MRKQEELELRPKFCPLSSSHTLPSKKRRTEKRGKSAPICHFPHSYIQRRDKKKGKKKSRVKEAQPLLPLNKEEEIAGEVFFFFLFRESGLCARCIGREKGGRPNKNPPLSLSGIGVGEGSCSKEEIKKCCLLLLLSSPCDHGKGIRSYPWMVR